MAPYSSVTSPSGADCAASSKQTVDRALRVGIEQEKLLRLNVGVTQQFQTILLGTGQSPLVTVDHAGGVILHRAQGDEALAGEALLGVGFGELLKIGEDRGFAVGSQNAGGDPALQIPGRARIHVVGFGVAGPALAQNDAHQVIRAQRQIARLHGRGNLVVWLSDQIGQRAGFWAVTKGLKRKDAGQVPE